jgi:protein phosphatase
MEQRLAEGEGAARTGPRWLAPGETLAILPGTFVVTVGAAGCGKTTFVQRHFPPEMVVSSDAIRHELYGDAAEQGGQARVWGRVYYRVRRRLAQGLTTVLDSTAATPRARQRALRVARQHGAPLLFLVFQMPLSVCLARNRARLDPTRSGPVPDVAVIQQFEQVSRFLASAQPRDEVQIAVLTPEAVDTVRVGLLAAARPEPRAP